MALRLRRGTNADRLTVTPAEGELLYTTDSKKIYAGDGSTVGGNIVSGINDLIEDLTPQLGGDLDLNSKTIVGNGNINITGDIVGNGNINITGDIVGNGNINITGTIDAGAITADIYGSVFGNDSQPLVDVINSKVILTNNSINELNDVSSSNATIGQVLKWSGTSWTPQNDTDTILNLSNESLNSLGDVNVAGVQINQVLTWSGGQWTASNIPSTVNNLTDLTDVTIINPLDNQLLKYNNNTSSWINFSLQLNDLTDVSAPAPNNNHIIKYNQSTGTWETELLTLSSLADVDTTALLLGDTLAWNGANWTASGGLGEIRETDIQGSVYGIDSSLIIDSVNNSINSDSITNSDFYSTTSEWRFNGQGGNLSRIFSGGELGGALTLLKISTGDLSSSTDTIGSLLFNRLDVNGNATVSGIFSGGGGYQGSATSNGLWLSHSYQTVYPLPYITKSAVLHEGNFGIGVVPVEKLEVEGNAKISGFTQFGSYTTTERDDLTTTNSPQYATNFGMVIYNTTTNTFQGWQNTGGTTPEWVNLS